MDKGIREDRKMNEQMKDLSASDAEGLSCPVRHGAERYLGMRIESPAMTFGIECHKVAQAVNETRRDGKNAGRDEIMALVSASPVDAALKSVAGGMEEALLWWAERTNGRRPLDVEKHRRVKIGKYWWQIKPDAVDETDDGVLLVGDYKKGFVPAAEVARRTLRFMLYAAISRKLYGARKVESELWNLSNKFMVRIVWEDEELDRIERYMDQVGDQIAGFHAQMQAVDEKDWPELFSRMTPRVNDWCPSCPVGLTGKCKPWTTLLRTGVVEPGADRIQTYEIVKAAAKAAKKVADTLDDALTAEALTLGAPVVQTTKDGDEYVIHTLASGEREAMVKTVRFPIKDFSDKGPLLKAVMQHGAREVVEEGEKVKKAVVVRTLDLGDGLVVKHRVAVDKEEPVKEAAREGQRVTLMVRRAL